MAGWTCYILMELRINGIMGKIVWNPAETAVSYQAKFKTHAPYRLHAPVTSTPGHDIVQESSLGAYGEAFALGAKIKTLVTPGLRFAGK